LFAWLAPEHYDVIIAGGSISGLLCAREIASKGLSVLVLEQNAEIGTPEHCSGVVSLAGLKDLGIIPDSTILQNYVSIARINSPSTFFELHTKSQNVIVVDRRSLDKHVAKLAYNYGAEIRTRRSFKSIIEDQRHRYLIKTSGKEVSCDYFVDARGLRFLNDPVRGILPSAQFEVYAPWIESDMIEVSLDNSKFPGYFAWIIPTGDGKGKVGVAGRGINGESTLQMFMNSKGKNYSVIRKIFAPIWVGGSIESFVHDRTLIIGDAAGQTKPTTAGGIYTCGFGGILAGRAICKAVKENDDLELGIYETDWRAKFQKEFNMMKIIRIFFERLDNKSIDEIFFALSKNRIDEIANFGDFDFHSNALSLVFGTKIAPWLAKSFLSNEFRRLMGRNGNMTQVTR
jgi:geranylgeranyl reductase family protein